MRELLIRYLLGELDADEQRDVQARLQNSPELQRELARLRECFEAHQDEDTKTDVPPGGLASRTTERVMGCSESPEAVAGGDKPVFAQAGDPPAGILGWSLADLTVAGGVMLAVSMLIFPALRNSRDGTRRQVCQNNQRQLWVLVSNYAQDHGGEYPRVRPNENAGVFAAHLIAKGYVGPEDLALILVCPAAPLANDVRSGQLAMRLPNAAELRAMTAAELAQATATMSPFYAYRFPYRIGRQYHYDIRDEQQRLSPVFADTSGDDENDPMSPNHGGKFIQVQCADGSLRTLKSPILPGSDDDMFHNDLGKIAAGMSRHDSVLGRSDAMPGDEFAMRAK